MEFLSPGAIPPLECTFCFCMSDRIIYWLAVAVITVMRRLPLSVCFALGQVIGVLLWLLLPAYRKLARENLYTAYGHEKSPAEIRALAFKHFVTLGANAVSAFKIAALSQADILRIAKIERLDRIRENIAKGRGVLLAINHIGNWELYAQLVFQVPEARFGTVFQALHNKLLDNLINEDRKRLGVSTFDRKKGFNAAISLIREPGIVGVLVDQNASTGGTWMPFYGRMASTSPLAATLAQRTDAAVIPVAIYTTGFAKWRVVLSEEIPWDTNTSAEQLTCDINNALEKQINESPADWFWVHNRWRTPHPGFLTVTQKRGTYFPPGTEVDKLRRFRILLRSPNWLGDAVMSIRAARAFKHGRPDAHVTVLTPAKLAPLWRSVPEIDEVIAIEPKEGLLSVARKVRAGNFDVSVLFPNSLRSALEVWLGGVERRVGFAGHRRKRLINQLVLEKKSKGAPKPEHHSDRYWRIAKLCGAVEPPPLIQHRPAAQGSLPVIAICPGAEYGPAKRWPTESFRRAIEIIHAQRPCRFIIVGVAADTTLALEIMQGFTGQIEDLTGQTTLDQLIEVLKGVTALLTNDTGTMHLADWLGTPLVAVFGSTDHILTGPKSLQSTVVRHQVECSPCFLRECPLDFRCMKAVTPEEAAAALGKMVDREGIEPPTNSV